MKHDLTIEQFKTKMLALINSRVPTIAQYTKCPDEIINLIDVYMGPKRFYHGINHILECISCLDRNWEFWREYHNFSYEDYVAAFFALAFHDYVCQPGNPDNELRSAEYAKSCLGQLGIRRNITDRVHNLIFATDYSRENRPNSILAQCIRDIDLVGLGSEWAVFQDNYEQIRKEFVPTYPLSQFLRGRIKFLTNMLNQPIYCTVGAQNLYEKRARENIERHLKDLDKELTLDRLRT